MYAGVGTAAELAMQERESLAIEGIVVVAIVAIQRFHLTLAVDAVLYFVHAGVQAQAVQLTVVQSAYQSAATGCSMKELLLSILLLCMQGYWHSC